MHKQLADEKPNDQISDALEHLDHRLIGFSTSKEFIDQLNRMKKIRDENGKPSEEYVRLNISLSKSLYIAGRMTYEESYYMISWSVESLIRDSRWTD